MKFGGGAKRGSIVGVRESKISITLMRIRPDDQTSNIEINNQQSIPLGGLCSLIHPYSVVTLT